MLYTTGEYKVYIINKPGVRVAPCEGGPLEDRPLKDYSVLANYLADYLAIQSETSGVGRNRWSKSLRTGLLRRSYTIEQLPQSRECAVGLTRYLPHP